MMGERFASNSRAEVADPIADDLPTGDEEIPYLEKT